MPTVVVVGGGLAGATAALYLAERGAKVNLVEAEQPGSAASGAAAGLLAPQYECAEAGAHFEALVRSREYFPEFAATVESLCGERLRLRREGMLVANRTDEEHRRSEAKRDWQGRAGQEAEIIDTSAALRLQPGVTDAAVSYLWLPREGQVDSQHLAGLLPALLERAGVQVLGRRRVREVQFRRGVVEGVELTDDRRLAADAVVVATGAWSAILEQMPYRVPVSPIRGHVLRFAAGAARLDHMVAEQEGRFVLPRDDGTVLAGTSQERAGFDRSVDEAAVQAIHQAVAWLVPALSSQQPAASWADLRPMPVDGLPIIGADPEVPGLFYATGYGRTGILLSPLAGRVIADLVLDGSLPEEWQAFTPARMQALPSHRSPEPR